MDYVVGGVAALISGNVTPNRPKLVKRALTPIKHQPSPNVTPKSELVDDRSIFLSPSVQKKKAIVKKSPKRIFQNPELDETCDGVNNSSPKADKVKKHLQENLEASFSTEKSSKSPKKNKNEDVLLHANSVTESPQTANEHTPKKEKKRNATIDSNTTTKLDSATKSPKSEKKRKIDLLQFSEQDKEIEKNWVGQSSMKDIAMASLENVEKDSPKKKKNKKKKNKSNKDDVETQIAIENQTEVFEKKSKKVKKKKNKSHSDNVNDHVISEANSEIKKSKKKNKTFVNPNAITNQDSDSEHESDNEILSENEEANKEILDSHPADESSDEEPQKEKKLEPKEKPVIVTTEDEIKRTLFVGNVPFSKKCKKEIKKIFSKYGAIETVRIRTIPVKDARVTPKLAVIKNELHPERTTVNVYVKFKDASSVEQALAENNTVMEGCHLRVTRSDAMGADHDPRCAVFVGNMPFALEDNALREKFAKCGDIMSVRIIRDRKTNAGKGFGFVNFASKDGVELALTLSEEDLTIKNRIMRVKRCTQITQKQQNFKNNRQGGNQGMQGKNQGVHGKFGGGGPKQWGQKQNGLGEGAQRRIMNKRKSQDNGEGPDEKRPKNLNQPQKEKKERKEFVGMTAEKKKKHTFNKGQKKKKALSEILTK